MSTLTLWKKYFIGPLGLCWRYIQLHSFGGCKKRDVHFKGGRFRRWQKQYLFLHQRKLSRIYHRPTGRWNLPEEFPGQGDNSTLQSVRFGFWRVSDVNGYGVCECEGRQRGPKVPADNILVNIMHFTLSFFSKIDMSCNFITHKTMSCFDIKNHLYAL